MKVVWTEFALEEVLNTAQYILDNFGVKTHENFLQQIAHFETLIALMPQMGKKEPFLEDETIEYRSFVLTSVNKVVYYIEGDDVVIADFWNMRRSPKTVTDRLLT